MATYRVSRVDGHPFVVRGYPVLGDDGRQDVRFSTYQVHLGAEDVFTLAQFVDGESVPATTFYALLVQGDLWNTARPKGIDIDSVPARFIPEDVPPRFDPRMAAVRRETTLAGAYRRLLGQWTAADGVDLIKDLSRERLRSCLETVCVFWLHRLRRQ